MQTQRWRPVFLSALVVVVIWVLAIVGYSVAKNSRVTADKVKAYAESIDLSKLSANALIRT